MSSAKRYAKFIKVIETRQSILGEALRSATFARDALTLQLNEAFNLWESAAWGGSKLTSWLARRISRIQKDLEFAQDLVDERLRARRKLDARLKHFQSRHRDEAARTERMLEELRTAELVVTDELRRRQDRRKAAQR